MEHLPIYRSTARRSGAAWIPWRRTVSLATAAAALTVSGIALGYHGFAPAAAPSIASDAGTGSVVAVPDFTVQFANSGHPDIISALTTTLLARVPIGPSLIQALSSGPLGPVFGPEPQPQLQPTDAPPLEVTLADEPLALPVDPIVEVSAPAEADLAAAPDASIVSAAVLAVPPLRISAAALMAAPVEDTGSQVAAAQEPPAAPAPDLAPDPTPAQGVVAVAEPAAAAAKPARTTAPAPDAPPAVVHVAAAPPPVVHVAVAPPARAPAPQAERAAPEQKPVEVQLQRGAPQARASADDSASAARPAKVTSGEVRANTATNASDNKQGNDNGTNKSTDTNKGSDNGKGSAKRGG